MKQLLTILFAGMVYIAPAQVMPRMVKLSVVNDRIIRVQATPESNFPKKNSLIIDSAMINNSNLRSTTVNIGEASGTETIETNCIKALVDRQTGAITFCDKSGNILLKRLEWSLA